MDPQELEVLRSLDDRLALASVVERALAPPRALARIYSQMVEDAGSMGGPMPPDLPEDRLEQVRWIGQRLREQFLEAAANMLDLSRRMRLHQPREHWSPFPWVYAARDLDATSGLLALVIAQAPSMSWPSWVLAFEHQQGWSAQWDGWEQAFQANPALAMRWLDLVLAPPSAGERPERLARLSFCRGRLWQRIHAAESAGRQVPLLRGLDGRLAEVGARRDLAGVDYATLLADGPGGVSPDHARQALAGFLGATLPEAKDWVSGLDASRLTGFTLGRDRPVRRGLALVSWLGSQGECGAGDLAHVFSQWAFLLDDARWDNIFDDALLALLGLPPRRKSGGQEARSTPPARKKKKARRRKPGKQDQPPKPAAKTGSGLPPARPLESIPRFSRR